MGGREGGRREGEEEEEGTWEGGRVGIAACGGRRSPGSQRQGEAEPRSGLNGDRALRPRGRRAGTQSTTESGSEAGGGGEGGAREPPGGEPEPRCRRAGTTWPTHSLTHTHTHTLPERALAANRQHGAGALARARAAARELLRLTEPSPAAGAEDRAGPSPPARRLAARPAPPHPYAAQSPPLRRADPEGSRLAAKGDGGERARRRERAAGTRGRQTLLLAALPLPGSFSSP